MSEPNFNRRDLFKLIGVGVAFAAGTRLIKPAQASESAPAGGRNWAMVIDQSKCEGCGYCTLACRAHNDVAPEISWNRVDADGEVAGKPVFLPRPCMQCAKAPCVDVCPVQASTYRPDGIVMMDYDRCIGCRYCEVACPYGARAFNWKAFDGDNPAVPEWGQPEVERRPRGVVEKCAFCYQRIDRGLALGLTPGVDADATPACVVACPVAARKFGDLNDPNSEVSQLLKGRHAYRLREDLGTGPRVYYLPAGEAGS
jgi:Fe-S-cluster-containing dehydrogenase component